MSRYISLLARYLRPHVPQVSLLSVCFLGTIGLQLFIPQIVRSFIDLAGAGGAMNDLMHLALIYLSLSIVGQLLTASSAYLPKTSAGGRLIYSGRISFGKRLISTWRTTRTTCQAK